MAIGHYSSEEFFEGAGFSVGSLKSDLELKKDSSFYYRHFAIRYGMRDIVVIDSTSGNWKISNNQLLLYFRETIINKVDSIYNIIPNKQTIIKNHNKPNIVNIRFCKNDTNINLIGKYFEEMTKTIYHK
jgi:hypothetical protein